MLLPHKDSLKISTRLFKRCTNWKPKNQHKKPLNKLMKKLLNWKLKYEIIKMHKKSWRKTELRQSLGRSSFKGGAGLKVLRLNMIYDRTATGGGRGSCPNAMRHSRKSFQPLRKAGFGVGSVLSRQCKYWNGWTTKNSQECM